MTACVAPLTTVILDAAPCDLGGSASGVNNAAVRLGGLVAVAALGYAFGGTSASDVASVAVVEAYPARDVDRGDARRGRRVDGTGLARQ